MHLHSLTNTNMDTHKMLKKKNTPAIEAINFVRTSTLCCGCLMLPCAKHLCAHHTAAKSCAQSTSGTFHNHLAHRHRSLAIYTLGPAGIPPMSEKEKETHPRMPSIEAAPPSESLFAVAQLMGHPSKLGQIWRAPSHTSCFCREEVVRDCTGRRIALPLSAHLFMRPPVHIAHRINTSTHSRSVRAHGCHDSGNWPGIYIRCTHKYVYIYICILSLNLVVSVWTGTPHPAPLGQPFITVPYITDDLHAPQHSHPTRVKSAITRIRCWLPTQRHSRATSNSLCQRLLRASRKGIQRLDQHTHVCHTPNWKRAFQKEPASGCEKPQ